jgi:hypothetical protein
MIQEEVSCRAFYNDEVKLNNDVVNINNDVVEINCSIYCSK